MAHDTVVVLAELLSNFPVGSRIRKLENKLVGVVQGEPDDTILRQCFPVHPLYKDSAKLDDALQILRMGGSLASWGLEYDDEVTAILHGFARKHRDELSQNIRAYLAQKAREIQAYVDEPILSR